MYFHFKNKLFLFSILSFVVFLFIPIPFSLSFFFFFLKYSKQLNIADPPYTVFNFSTEVSSDHDIIQDELEKKEDEKRDRSSKMLDKLLSNAIDFF
ncbi:hypothetical protein PFHG_00901 [Plasmodium falciparum HB3]|uniref:Uncharacterized protein n=1 Tax=Plasmodium falciparum (isolate HB3) TaxID=137071 RepID=A0A0L7K8F8_PLAFX|nr:hypothetical protein PFHG_00901 [Plasmodium falciparum HB3]